MKAAIVGGSGYLGVELLRLLAGHDEFEIARVQAETAAGTLVGDLYPGLHAAYAELVYEPVDLDALAGCDVVFVAVPSGASQAIVASLVGRVGCVVDLGADFRLKDTSLYPTWYGFEHQEPALVASAVYGLVELNRPALIGASLIAAPGCYVTAASLGLAPLVAGGFVADDAVIVDGASGTSGAGRVPTPDTHHAVVNENFSAYRVISHRHTPEMEQAIGAPVLFTPHLVPMTRGILTTSYARSAGPTSSAALTQALRDAYAGEPFVAVVDDPPSTRDVYATNNARIAARYDERTGRIVVLCAIDNLTKGGAGQAIQAANVALGVRETTGLPVVAVAP